MFAFNHSRSILVLENKGFPLSLDERVSLWSKVRVIDFEYPCFFSLLFSVLPQKFIILIKDLQFLLLLILSLQQALFLWTSFQRSEISQCRDLILQGGFLNGNVIERTNRVGIYFREATVLSFSSSQLSILRPAQVLVHMS